MRWTHEIFPEPTIFGDIAAYRAVGATAIEYTIMEAADPERRFNLVWIERPGHVAFTGKGPNIGYFFAKADAMERER